MNQTIEAARFCVNEKAHESNSVFSIDSLVSMVESINSAIQGIHAEVQQSRIVANDTLNDYKKTSQQIEELGTSTLAISKVISLIDSVAARTNMLGLNASIEAAKAGDSGKGFAVVAGEVKVLANQTSSATQTVRDNIDSLSMTCGLVRSALEALLHSIGKITQSSDAIEFGTNTQKQLLANLHRESLRLTEQFRTQNNQRLENIAQNVVQLIVRNLYERTADVRWWATDPSLVGASGLEPTCEEASSKSNFAAQRLSMINRFYSVYRNLILLSRDGLVLGCSNTADFGCLVGQNLVTEDWFRKSIRISSGDEYHAEKIFFDRNHANEAVSIFATAVREGGRVDGEPIGVLGVVFDWEAQVASVVRNESGLTKDEMRKSRVLVLDKQLRIIGDSNGKPSLAKYPLQNANAQCGSYVDKQGNYVSYAKTLGYQEFDGLGLIGVIETQQDSLRA